MHGRTKAGIKGALLWALLYAACATQGAGDRAARAPGASPRRGQVDPGQLARRIHQIVNQQRRQRGLRALRWDGKLAGLAARHSRDMVRHRFFSHANHRGESPTQRGRRAGIRCRRKNPDGSIRVGLAENIHQNNLYSSVSITTDHRGVTRKRYQWNSLELIARSTVQDWMNSPGHRRNILDRGLDTEGIGVAVNAQGQVFITQVFC